MTPELLQEYALFAEKLADSSSAFLRQRARGALQIEQKPDRSFVTQVDHQVEALLRAQIQETWPTHGILGEEYGGERENADWLWIIDPIDGTSSFLAGRPTFTTLISLCFQGTPVIGVIDQPLMRDRWSGCYWPNANIRTAKFNHGLAQTRSCKDLAAAMLATTGPQYFSPTGFAAFGRLQNSCNHTLYGGDAYNYGLLASGWLDIVLEENLKPHDFCALYPVINGAGGWMGDWQGTPLSRHSKGQVLALGDASLKDAVLAMLF